MVRSFHAMAIALVLAATPAAAQLAGSDGEAFIAAMKNGEGGKAIELIDKAGSTVVNYRGDDGNTALHIATHNRNGNWVGYLLSKDADPNVGDRNGDTPLILAARLNFPEGAARLLMKKALVDKTNKLGETGPDRCCPAAPGGHRPNAAGGRRRSRQDLTTPAAIRRATMPNGTAVRPKC
jgi:hypothetical protein